MSSLCPREERDKAEKLTKIRAGGDAMLLFQTSELGTLPKKINVIFWEFFPKGGGGLRNSQNYFIFTVSFFVCQNMEVLGGVPYSQT